ncbi:purine and uridine phosphorylase [Colletotrichum somersetense]|nr:purine and uridine phosphorylase [Colletotrichum somersetense]
MGTNKRTHNNLTRDAYTVGWICALPVEQAAAVTMLDIKHECPPVHEDDTNNYELGRIGMHNVAITCMSSYGSVNAAVVASHMIRTFPSIRIRLMVGIGGGAPARNDVRLGDIVVSHPTATPTGTGELNKPPQELLTAVAVLKAHHESRPSQIPDILEGLKEQNLRVAYPGKEARPDNNPRTHYGVIASGNQVMKHGKTRDRIAEKLNVLCFEMEAAGLMDNFPYLVIRGICDYADSHKAKEWQPLQIVLPRARLSCTLASLVATNRISTSTTA